MLVLTGRYSCVFFSELSMFVSAFNNCREELIRLRAIKPAPGARKEAEYIPPPATAEVEQDTATDMDMSTFIDMEEETVEKPLQEQSISTVVPPTAMDDDSDGEAVGKDEAAELDRDMMSDENANDDPTDEPVPPGGKVSTMFQRLMNMNVAAGQVVLGSPAQQQPEEHAPFRASVVQNGRMICNLPDHPIHAGATAIVAVLTAHTLTVANAGDSRAVLCRKESTVPLSFDHKPMQETELNRIKKAGGFVNNFGRVNGNLNLSRSIGDLKYKQVPGISPAEQMITAEPDIVQ